MRIARVLTRLNLGGPARQVLASDPVLAERGHEVRVFAGRPETGEGDLSDELAGRGIDVVHVPGLRRGLSALWTGDDRRAKAFLAAELRAYDPEIVHTHASKAGAIGRRVAAEAVPAAVRVHTFHGHVLEGYFPLPISAILRRIEARLAEGTDGIIAVSEATRADLDRLGVVPADRVDVCPPGVDLDRLLELDPGRPEGALRRSLSIPLDAVVIGMIGRLAPVKRTALGIEVFAGLAHEFPSAWLAVAGDGAERPQLERQVAELPAAIRDRVLLLGALTDMVPFHAAIDVLLSTSFSEGMPVAMIEAAAAGRPVVSTAVGGVPELVRSGVTGLFGTDRDALCAALAGLLGDQDTRIAMGERARKRAISVHTQEALATRLEVIYARLLTCRA